MSGCPSWCIYCGEPTLGALTCVDHRDLLALDPNVCGRSPIDTTREAR